LVITNGGWKEKPFVVKEKPSVIFKTYPRLHFMILSEFFFGQCQQSTPVKYDIFMRCDGNAVGKVQVKVVDDRVGMGASRVGEINELHTYQLIRKEGHLPFDVDGPLLDHFGKIISETLITLKQYFNARR